MPAWIVFLVIAVLVLVVVGWLIAVDAVVRVEPGQLGLVLHKGRATDRVLAPGPHFVPTFRRKMVEKYPSLELAYRAGDREMAEVADHALENGGPPLVVALGDRATVTLSYTVRFRLDLDELRSVHERFGRQGIWAAVRDQSAASVRRRLCEDGVGVNDLYGPARRALETELAERLESELGNEGLRLVLFTLGDTDLGRTGEVIQATTRARYELEREVAEAETRRARVRNDAELGLVVGDAPMDAALRYREVDAWREVAWTMVARGGALPPPASVRSTAPPPEPTLEPAVVEPGEMTEQ